MPCIPFPHIVWWIEALRSGPEPGLYTGPALLSAGYRNRYRIATANGAQLLSVPVRGGRRTKAALNDTPIDETHDWRRQHWGALYSAYGRAPFFEHYGPELRALIFGAQGTLEAFNLATIGWLAASMRLSLRFVETPAPEPRAALLYRQLALPEKAVGLSHPPYHQVFEDRFGFLPHLSAIDLLMAEGPHAASYLGGQG